MSSTLLAWLLQLSGALTTPTVGPFEMEAI